MKLIVGLGNPGKEYDKTRHNLGFMTVDSLLKALEPKSETVWSEQDRFKSYISEILWQTNAGSEKVLLVKPKTFMNNSGMAVSLLVNYYKLPPEDVWLVYDELDLPLGTIKIRFGGAAAGHKGVESVINSLGTDKFWRFRLGIGESHQSSINDDKNDVRTPVARQKISDVSDFVLSKFGGAQWGRARELIKRGTKALETALSHGLKTAMHQFNAN